MKHRENRSRMLCFVCIFFSKNNNNNDNSNINNNNNNNNKNNNNILACSNRSRVIIQTLQQSKRASITI